jgi:hypothetical protein
MVMPTAKAASRNLGEPRSRTELRLEMIALRHQLAVLKRSGTRRPCFGLWDRLFWIFLSWWWPRWPESLLIIQPETVKTLAPQRLVRTVEISVTRSLARRTSQGCARGPRTDRSDGSGKLPLGAPRIHGELLMLGYKVSQATVSRYLSTLYRGPGQSWRTFIRNQALAFRYRDDPHYGNQDYVSLVDFVHPGKITRPAEWSLGQGADNRSMFHTRVIAVRARRRARGARFRSAWAPDRSVTARENPVSVSVQMRGPPHHARLRKRRYAQNDVD